MFIISAYMFVEGKPYVKVIASNPPPAPARACAMLSLCWAAEVAGTGS